MGQDECVFRVRRRSADADAKRADERQMMRVGIAGAGAVGRSVAQELLDYGHKVLLIEHNVRHYEPHTVPGAEWLWADACELSSLEESGIQMCDVVIAATGDDKVNLTAALLAKTEFGVARVVARVNDLRNEWLFTEAWGVDVAVSAPSALVAAIEGAIDIGHLVRLMELRQGQVSLAKLTLPDERSIRRSADARPIPAGEHRTGRRHSRERDRSAAARRRARGRRRDVVLHRRCCGEPSPGPCPRRHLAAR